MVTRCTCGNRHTCPPWVWTGRKIIMRKSDSHARWVLCMEKVQLRTSSMSTLRKETSGSFELRLSKRGAIMRPASHHHLLHSWHTYSLGNFNAKVRIKRKGGLAVKVLGLWNENKMHMVWDYEWLQSTFASQTQWEQAWKLTRTAPCRCKVHNGQFAAPCCKEL